MSLVNWSEPEWAGGLAGEGCSGGFSLSFYLRFFVHYMMIWRDLLVSRHQGGVKYESWTPFKALVGQET